MDIEESSPHSLLRWREGWPRLAADRDELEAMTALQDLLKDVHLILAIPDGERHTVELAFHLFPRFLFQKGEDFTDVEKVLSKMIQSQPDPKAPDKEARNDMRFNPDER